MTCYVCGKEIEPREVSPADYGSAHLDTFITVIHGHWYRRIDLPVYIGQDTYRHASCEPGSAKWMKSVVGKKSSIRKYFKLARKGATEDHA